MELLGYIFELACRNVALSIDSISKSVSMMRKTRNAISLTCSWWREAALSTSILWRAITIMDRNDVRHLTDPDRFSAYIQRAKYRKLVAFLCPPEPTDWEQLQGHLVPVLSRCETIISSDHNMHTLSPAFTTTHWAALKSLVIKWVSCREWVPHTINLTSAHSLESLWCRVDLLHSSVTLTFRVPTASAITRLSLEGGDIAPRCSLSLIRSCPQLKLLRWSYPLAYDPHDNMELTKTESLPNLLGLCVRGELPTRFMTRLAAPNLHRLVYTQDFRLQDTQHPFHDPSQFPNLRSLEIGDYKNTSFPMLLAPFLRTHGELRRLHLPWRLSQERDLLEALASISTLPNLEYVRTWDSPEHTAAEALLEQRVPQNPVQDGHHEKAKKFTLHLRHELLFSDGATRLIERFGDSVCYERYFDDSDPWSWPIEV